MGLHRTAVLAAVLAAGVCGAEWDGDELVLKDSSFETELESRELSLVLFYASWCGASKQMFPLFSSAASMAKKSGIDVTFAKVDAEENQGSKQRAHAAPGGMTGYPTLKLSRFGVLEQWTGSNSRVPELPTKLVSHLLSLQRTTMEVLTDAQVVKSRFHKKNADNMTRAAVVGYFGQVGLDHRVFRAVASQLHGVSDFYAVTDKSVLEKLGFLGSGSTIMLYRPWLRKGFKTVYSGVLTKGPLRDWLVKESFEPVPFVPDAQISNFRDHVKSRKLQGVLVALVDSVRPDPTDVKPAGWDQPKEIDDPSAELPADWDEEEDGPWTPPTIDNPAYRGEWKPREAPDYRIIADVRDAVAPVLAEYGSKVGAAIYDIKADGPGKDLAEELGFDVVDTQPAAVARPAGDLKRKIASLEKEKVRAAEELEFEKALELKQQIAKLKGELALGESQSEGAGDAIPTQAFAIVEGGKRGRRFKYNPRRDGPLLDWVGKYARKSLAPYSKISVDEL